MPKISIIALCTWVSVLASASAHSQSVFNPTIPAAGFNVFTKSAVQFSSGTIDGPVATGGDAILAGSTSISLSYSGYHPSGNGSPLNYGLVIGGRIWYNSGGQTQISHGQVRLGQLTGGNLYELNGSLSQSQILLTPGAQSATPNILTSSQTQLNTATTGNGLNFTTAFNAFQNYSTTINNYPVTHSTSTTFNYFSMPRVSGGGTHFITVISGKVNYITMTAAQFAAMNGSGIIYYFNRALDSSTVVVFNITASGTVNWDPPTWGALSDNSMADGRYILYNFPNASRINIIGTNPTIGNILAPNASIFKTSSNNSAGTIIADTLALQSGSLRYAPFGGQLPGLSTALPLEQLALGGTTAGDRVQLNWDAASRPAGAELSLERSSDGSVYETRAQLGSGTTGTWTESVSRTGGALYYRLRLSSPGGSSRVSAVWRANLRQPENDVEITPNPFADRIEINNSNGKLDWALYSATGQRVRSGTCEGRCTVTELAGLPAGDYIFRTTAGGRETVRQLLKR